MSENKRKRILGIDPGTRISGFGIIDVEDRNYTPIDYGCIRPPVNYILSDRYLVLYTSVIELIKKYEPTAIVVETQFVYKNIQSAIKLGMARGAVLIAAKSCGLPIYEYAPTKAKKAVVGKGRASKYQVQSMVKHLLNLETVPEPEDAADALALAICHAQTALHLIHQFEI